MKKIFNILMIAIIAAAVNTARNFFRPLLRRAL